MKKLLLVLLLAGCATPYKVGDPLPYYNESPDYAALQAMEIILSPFLFYPSYPLYCYACWPRKIEVQVTAPHHHHNLGEGK